MANDLRALIQNLQPALSDGKFFMGTFSESQLMGLAGHLQHIVCIFREKEGISAIFSDAAKESLQLYTENKMEGSFALITLGVQSPLLSVGLLAKVAECLSKEGIPANAFSAYYHDHLLVPYEQRDKALAALKKLEKSA